MGGGGGFLLVAEISGGLTGGGGCRGILLYNTGIKYMYCIYFYHIQAQAHFILFTFFSMCVNIEHFNAILKFFEVCKAGPKFNAL